MFGPGNATIVFDDILGVNVAAFDGNVRIEVGVIYIRTWIVTSDIVVGYLVACFYVDVE